MINHIPHRTAKTDALTTLLRSDLPDLGEIEVSRLETAPDRSGEADGLTVYLNQAARWARLTAEEELALGHRIKAGKLADGTLTPALMRWPSASSSSAVRRAQRAAWLR